MNTVKENLKKIETKDDLIKWLTNEYYYLTIKLYGTYDEVSEKERHSVMEKSKEILKNDNWRHFTTPDDSHVIISYRSIWHSDKNRIQSRE